MCLCLGMCMASWSRIGFQLWATLYGCWKSNSGPLQRAVQTCNCWACSSNENLNPEDLFPRKQLCSVWKSLNLPRFDLTIFRLLSCQALLLLLSLSLYPTLRPSRSVWVLCLSPPLGWCSHPCFALCSPARCVAKQATLFFSSVHLLLIQMTDPFCSRSRPYLLPKSPTLPWTTLNAHNSLWFLGSQT